jgi:hypothetical protein
MFSFQSAGVMGPSGPFKVYAPALKAFKCSRLYCIFVPMTDSIFCIFEGMLVSQNSSLVASRGEILHARFGPRARGSLAQTQQDPLTGWVSCHFSKRYLGLRQCDSGALTRRHFCFADPQRLDVGSKDYPVLYWTWNGQIASLSKWGKPSL